MGNNEKTYLHVRTLHSRPNAVLDFIFKATRKTNDTQNPQRVIGKSLVRIKRSSRDSPFEVFEAHSSKVLDLLGVDVVE